jgi:PAS domain S-box-containing protein
MSNKFSKPELFMSIHDKENNHHVIELRNLRLRIRELETALNEKIHTDEQPEHADNYINYFHNAADLIAVIDSKGIFLEINNRFEKESGYSRTEIINKNIATCGLLTKDSAERVFKNLKKVVSGKSTQMFEIDGITREGKIVPYEVRAVPIKKNSEIIAVQANLRNIEERRQVEHTLFKSEEHYHTLFQLSPSGILLENSKGQIIDVNPAFCQALGYDRKELIGKNIKITVQPEFVDNIEKNIKRLISGEFLKHVVKSLRKDGGYCYMQLNEKKISLPDGQDGILCIAEDISDRRRAEKELIKKNLIQENLLKTVRHLTRILDIKEVLKEVGNGVMTIMNLQSCAIYLLEKDLKTLRPVVAIDPKYKDEVLSTSLDIYNSFTGQAVISKRGLIFNETGPESIGHQIPNTPEEFEERIMVAPFHLEGKVIGAMCLSRMDANFTEDELSLAETFAIYASAALKNAQLFNDTRREVEERKLTEEKIHELNLQYESFIQNSLVGIWKLEFPKPIPINLPVKKMAELIIKGGIYTDCNDAEAKMYNFNSRSDIIGKYPNEIVIEFDSSTDRLERFVSNGFKTEMLETEEKDLNGNLHHFKNSYFGAIRENELHAIWGIQMDITDQRRLEEQLRQSQKLEAVGTLAGGIAHDFNNLLTVINGHAEISMLALEGDHPSHKDIISILSAGKKAKILTSQLLAFSRKQIYAPKIIEINRAISSLDKMLRRLIGEDIAIESNLRDGIPLIKADPGQIEQILMNLVVNARDAINEKGSISKDKKIIIETGQTVIDEAFVASHTGSKTGLHVVLTVSDTGIGMEEEIRDKIFEPFFTTKDKGLGTGLGMSTVYGIVKQNNGSIYAFSETGLGTRIKIYWPATEERKAPDETQVLTRAALLGQESILVVEDDEGVRNFVSTALKDLGYTVNEAINGKKALDVLNRNGRNIDLIITDLIMPEMNGKELATEVGKILPEIRVLFTSGYTEDSIVSSGSLERGIDFLQKPYSIQTLAKKVREVLDRN